MVHMDGDLKSNNIIGIDIGYGFTKTCGQNGVKIFNTAVTPTVPVETFGTITPITVNDKKFLVGGEALKEGFGLIETRTSSFIGSDSWIAVLGQALHINKFDIFRKGVIVLGIPPGHYDNVYAEELTKAIKKSSIICNKKNYNLLLAVIKIIPQGAGVFFSYFSLDKDADKKDVAIIDIGHHTIDMVLFSKGKYVEKATRSFPFGISVILDDIAKAFYRKHKLAIGHEKSLEILKKGHLTIFEEEYILDELQGMLSSYAEQITSLSENFFEGLSYYSPEVGIISGGGALALKDLIKIRYKLFIMDNPETLNAVGFWRYGMTIAEE